MMFTTPMKLLAAAVLKEDAAAVAESLLRLGVMDAISVRELSGSWDGQPGAAMGAALPTDRLARIEELRKRAESFFSMATPPLPLPDPARMPAAAGTPGAADEAVRGAVPLSEAELLAMGRGLDSLAAELSGARDRQKAAQDELLKLRDLRSQVEAMTGFESAAASAGSRSILELQSGTVPEGGFGALETALSGLPSVTLSGEASKGGRLGVLIISLRRDSQRVADALRRAGWERVSAEGAAAAAGREKADILSELDAKERTLAEERDRRGRELGGILAARSDELGRTWSSLRVEELSCRVRSAFSATERTVFLSGWIPEADRERVEEALRLASRGRCCVEWISPGGGEAKGLNAPVSMSNPPALKPFQDLVANYAMPEYGAIDPTPFVAVAYLCMFGLMFGDAGHGLVILLVGLLGLARARKKGAKDGLYRLIAYCGGAAIVSGLLFGSIFGQKLLPPLWFDYHGAVMGGESAGPVSSIYDVLGVTVRFGMAVLALGMVLNWVNLIRKRDWFSLVFDKAGLLGAWIYGAGAWAAFFFVAHDYKALPPPGILALGLGLPTLALGFKAPLEFIRERRHGHAEEKAGCGAAFAFVLEWLVEVLEIYSGYLANTLSFMRVAGLGIAHVSLMVAFAQIARMMSPGGGTSVGGIAVLVLGNALVIALEGLSAGIQSLRLNYYEFFSKYFNGTGRAYRPISLRARD